MLQRGFASIAANNLFSINGRRHDINSFACSNSGAQPGALRCISSSGPHDGAQSSTKDPEVFEVELRLTDKESMIFTTDEEELAEWGDDLTLQERYNVWLEQCGLEASFHGEKLEREAKLEEMDEAEWALGESLVNESRTDKIFHRDGTPLNEECLAAKAAMHDAMDRQEQEGGPYDEVDEAVEAYYWARLYSGRDSERIWSRD